MMRRVGTLLLALLGLFSCGLAEEAEGLTPNPYEDFTAEEVRAFVEALFSATAGTDAQQEAQARSGMAEEEIALRNAQGALYRAKTLPWLIAAFAEEGDEEAEGVLTEDSMSENSESGIFETEIIYTPQDSFSAFAENGQGTNYLELLAGMGGADWETALEITREICGMWLAQVDHTALQEMNGDYRCWIYAPDTQIDYPVVQSENNSDYLKRMFNGARNSAGTLFIDYRNLADFQDPNTLIYGHHMRNDSMFGSISDYADQTYFEAHPYMLVSSAQEVFLLEIFAGYTTSKDDHCYDIAISDEADMAAFIGAALEKSDFVSGAYLENTDRLVTLSTCAYAFKNARYILLGRILPLRTAQSETF